MVLFLMPLLLFPLSFLPKSITFFSQDVSLYECHRE
uniref:Uncharacterized protein n=1 Tax=Anguilla anguilla TaxID=7936 RepID=A0A0E9VI49_ANGAN